MVKKQVTNFRLSRELKAAGYPQEGLWWWTKHWSVKKGGFFSIQDSEALAFMRKLFKQGDMKHDSIG